MQCHIWAEAQYRHYKIQVHLQRMPLGTVNDVVKLHALSVLGISMNQVLRHGFNYSSISCVHYVNYRCPNFAVPFSLNFNMSPKRSRSNSSSSNVESHKNAPKTSARKSVVAEDESEEGQTVSKDNSKRKAKGLLANESGIGKRTKKRSSHTLENTFESDSMNEPVILPSKVEGEKSLQVRKKVLSRIATSSTKVVAEVDLSHGEPWTVLAHKKPQQGWVAYNPKTMRPPPLASDTPHMKIMSWNVNGLRALLKLESFSALELARRENFDVLCLQETKLQEKDVDAIKCSLLEGYDNSYWTCSVSKLGYSGAAIISRVKPHSIKYGLGISDHDSEGRLVTVEFDDFYLLCSYVPNSGDGLKRLSYRITQWDPSLSNYVKDLERSKPVILTGDLNCAHQEIDIFNPAGNKRSAGFTDEERDSFQKNFLDKGFVDTFRKQHPNVVGYTYWGYRHGGRKNNKGWRLDYFLASEAIADRVYDSYILPDVGGSDHSPIGLILKL